ncbi:MAG TPA: nucleotidyltransferase domain-containing protein [Egibacteraceae bacterium]|nr:nucleotidyltransferase domain-containing protein [Egibacteraceae bacterium]
MTPTPAEVIARRRAEQQALVARAARFVVALDETLVVRGAAVFGSVARGDFNDRSDIDVLVVAERLPEDPAERQLVVGSPAPGGVEAVVWKPEEWRDRRARRDPVAVDVEAHGIWLSGSMEDLEGGAGR